ncbi:MAG: alkaline phosphatase family protein [Gemmatimonadales bacterium]|nr:alkaline phosphatase family protein [Gemmatimonadales bacterium]
MLLPILLSAVQAAAPMVRASPVPPRLVVSLVIDQLRPDYLERWRPQFRGGLAWLLREGVFYANGEQDHAMTSTAAGHSTMLSGRSPASTGIIANDLGVPDRASPLIRSGGPGASPHRFRGTTLADWMVARNPATRIFSISRKDRGAIMAIGRARVPVYWYTQGTFTTSRYYADSLPSWLSAWNAREPATRLAGHAWELSRPAADYPEADARPFERGGIRHVFPHVLSTDPVAAAVELEAHTLIDSLTLDAAWAGVRATGLGTDAITDLLAISLSATDNIGHRYGPGSREVHDHLLNVDRWLGIFLDSLATIVPLDQLVVSLTSDHGVTEYPEAGAGGRASIGTEVTALNAWGRDTIGVRAGAVGYSGLLMARTGDLAKRGVDIDSLAGAIAARVRRLPGVLTVYTPRTLRAARATDAEAGRWRRQLPSDAEWLVAASLRPGWIWGRVGGETGHGTTNLDDRHVPILFRVPGTTPVRITRMVRTIDIGPTFAALLDIKPMERVEGVALREVLPKRSSR